MAATKTFLVTILVLSVLVAPSFALSWGSIKKMFSSMFSSSTYESGSEWPPAFCHEFDCPRFEVTEAFEDYELREYDASHWISTSDGDTTGNMFMRLFRYIEGANEEGAQIEMTVPVITSMVPNEEGGIVEDSKTMSFYVPSTIDRPTANDEFVVTDHNMDSTSVYVTTFSGFASEDDWIDHAAELAQALDRDGKQYDSAMYYSVGYDSPFKVFNRHNEVWYIAE